jgi:hypothetical protein
MLFRLYYILMDTHTNSITNFGDTECFSSRFKADEDESWNKNKWMLRKYTSHQLHTLRMAMTEFNGIWIIINWSFTMMA